MTTMIEGRSVETVTALTVPVSVFRDLSLASVAAGTNGTLPSLTGVLLEWHGGGARAVATDRYRLAVVDYWASNVPDSEWPDGVSGSALVPAKELASYVKTLPKMGARARWEPSVVIVPGDNEVSFSCVFDGGELSRTIPVIDGEFPRYQGLVPDTFGGNIGDDGVYMNAKFVADVAKMPGLAGRGTPTVRLRFTEPHRPMVWSAGNEETDSVTWRYLLMPVRVQS